VSHNPAQIWGIFSSAFSVVQYPVFQILWVLQWKQLPGKEESWDFSVHSRATVAPPQPPSCEALGGGVDILFSPLRIHYIYEMLQRFKK
jgi:hypothetical protein